MSMPQNILAANEMLSKSTVDLQPQLEQGPSLGRKPSSSRILDTRRIQKSWVSHRNPSSIINAGFIPAFKDDNGDENGWSISSVMSPHAIASFEHSNRKLRTYKRLEEFCSENEILQTQITSSGQCREDDFKLGYCFSQGRIHANSYDGHIGHAGHDGHNDNADSIHDHSKNENVPMRSMSALAFANTFENQAIVAPEYPNIFRRDFLCGTYTQLISGIIDPHNIKSSEIEVSPLKSNKHTTRKDYRFPDDERNGAGNSFGNRSYMMPRPPSIDERSWIQTQQPYPAVSVSAIRSALAHSRTSISARVSASMPMSKHMKPHRNKFPSSNNITFARYIPAVALPCTRAVVDVDDYNDDDPTTDGAGFSRMHVMQGYPSDHGEDSQGGSFGSDKESGDERQGSDDDQQDSEGQGNAGEGSGDSGSGEDNGSDENKDQLDGDDDEDDNEGEDEDEDEGEDEDDSDNCNDNNISSLHRAKGGFNVQFATDSTCAPLLSVQRSYSTPLRRNQYRSTSSSSTQSLTSPSLFRDIITAPQSLASTSSDSASRSLYASFRLQPQRQSNLSTPTDDPRRQFQDEFLANVSAAGLEVDASGYEVRRSSRRSSRQSITSTSQPTLGQIDMDIAREASRPSTSPQPLLEPAIEESKKQMIMDTTMEGTDLSIQQQLESTARKRTRDESFQEPTTGRSSSATRRPITLPSFREFLEMSSKPPPPLHNSVRSRVINSRFGGQLIGPTAFNAPCQHPIISVLLIELRFGLRLQVKFNLNASCCPTSLVTLQPKQTLDMVILGVQALSILIQAGYEPLSVKARRLATFAIDSIMEGIKDKAKVRRMDKIGTTIAAVEAASTTVVAIAGITSMIAEIKDITNGMDMDI
ncbi:hypothetical protein BGZ51_003481 [Haplosporangium sp. Z 767]|nr:hypothetical protein BGZ51_003481 [Haplosporangium sp. Z 767]